MKTSHWHIIPVLVLMLMAACNEAPCNEAPRHEAIAPGAMVLVLGDSITHGTGARRDQSYPTLLARDTGWNVINAGIPGDTASGARARLPALLEQHQPDLVIVELGGNDFLRKRQESAVSNDLLHIITTASNSGAQVILIAVPRLSMLRAGIGALQDSAIYADLASQTGAVLVGDILSEVLSDSALRADRIHPNAEGYRIFTIGLVAALRSEGLLQR